VIRHLFGGFTPASEVPCCAGRTTPHKNRTTMHERCKKATRPSARTSQSGPGVSAAFFGTKLRGEKDDQQRQCREDKKGEPHSGDLR